MTVPIKDAVLAASRMPILNGRLFRKYIALFVGVVCVALIANGLSETWISYTEQNRFLMGEQRDHAQVAAARITQFVGEIEKQIGWTTQLPWYPGDLDDRHVDAVRLLHQMPAISELTQVDRLGHEQLRVSQLAPDVLRSGADLARDIRFVSTLAGKVYYGPVFFLHDSEPHMFVAMAGGRSDSLISIADVNLKFVLDVMSQIGAKTVGQAYIVDAQDRLIAHPDLSLVLRKTDVSHLPQVQAARKGLTDEPDGQVMTATDLYGRDVLTGYATVVPLNWLVFVELPLNQAYASLYAAAGRSGLLLLVALALAVLAGTVLARRMIVPIHELRRSVALIGAGDLDLHISIETGDELEELGEEFNSMAAKLRESYATLERKVEERTQELAMANEAKSRFLAAASHDLRQPLHALGLFVSQLESNPDAPDRRQTIERIGAALRGMSELFGALLDISKLDAGVFKTEITAFPVARLLQRMDSTFADAAGEKELSLRVVSSRAWIRTDPILLERVLLNLMSNAIRYTNHGGMVVGCRRRAGRLRIEVWDTGPGIPPDQHQKIFSEFYRLADRGAGESGGLGLGLAIVERLCRLLDHPIELSSISGKGSRFSVTVPLAPTLSEFASAPTAPPAIDSAFAGKLIVVIDDNALVRESMAGLLRTWNCDVVVADCYRAARACLAADGRAPDLIISDYHLSDDISGIVAIDYLRHEFGKIRAFLISGDINAERVRIARGSGHHLLHKPVSPIALRALLNGLANTDLGSGGA
jgi:signal transduction histidine kinase